VLPVDTAPGSAFNPKRKHPITGKVKPHTGQDFPCPVGTPVRAVLPGKVEKTGFDPETEDGGTGAGRYLRLDHGLIDGHRITSRMYHLSAVLATRTVDAGEVVALSGNSGDSTGPHLHFEIRVDGVPVDPMAWLAQHTEEDDDMPTPQEIADAVWQHALANPSGVGTEPAWFHLVTRAGVAQVVDEVGQRIKDIFRSEEFQGYFAKGGAGVDLAQLEAAVTAAVKAALHGARIVAP
jgi:hypothetical protein